MLLKSQQTTKIVGNKLFPFKDPLGPVEDPFEDTEGIYKLGWEFAIPPAGIELVGVIVSNIVDFKFTPRFWRMSCKQPSISDSIGITGTRRSDIRLSQEFLIIWISFLYFFSNMVANYRLSEMIEWNILQFIYIHFSYTCQNGCYLTLHTGRALLFLIQVFNTLVYRRNILC